jgi:hypothetical protein
MKTLLVLKNIEKRIITAHYFKNEEEAFNEWGCWPCNLDWEIVYLKDRQKSGHRYELEYAKFDECGELYSKYIVCFTKKEALYLKNKIKEVNSEYLFNIKKLY